jgi:N-acyl homoserine lactone hydrolase
MPTAAEPRPALLPLPGGRRGATVRLHPLLTGTALFPADWLVRAPRRLAGPRALAVRVPHERWRRIPIPAFCVEHPNAGALLVDTGLHPSVAVRPRANLGRAATVAFRRIEMRPDQAAPVQLGARGLDPRAVGLVVLTHLHVDHASAISEFPDATFLVDAREWRVATTSGPLRAALEGYRRRQFDHAFDYRRVDFDSSETSSYSTFGRSVDVFGDGSVRLVSTPGHTAGHMSVVLRLEGREALIAGDAIYLERTLSDSAPPYRMQDEHRWRRSLRELQLYARERPDALIVPGHDMAAWQRLQPVYA